jgi:hypothetical protein
MTESDYDPYQSGDSASDGVYSDSGAAGVGSDSYAMMMMLGDGAFKVDIAEGDATGTPHGRAKRSRMELKGGLIDRLDPPSSTIAKNVRSGFTVGHTLEL